MGGKTWIAPVVVLVVASGISGQPRAHASTAPPIEEHVEARDDYFLPSTVTVKRGGTVAWDFTGLSTHTATDTTGMGLFDSGLVHPGGPSFSYMYVAAGSYSYTCTLHVGMDGTVKIPIRAFPKRGPASSSFTVVWASEVAPAGFAYDVQVKRKGRTWKPWKDSVSYSGASYLPALRGTFRFRARLRTDSGAFSGWSEPDSISVI